MNKTDDFARTYSEAVPQEVAGAVNLMAHPLAGIAAASALGFGFASHAYGMWMGVMSGAAEASQKMLAGLAEAEKTNRPAARLTLVSSQPAPKRQQPVKKTAPRKTAARAVETAVSGPRQPMATQRPATPDDLKAISGVGPKLETVLNGLGIWTYAQIAALNGDEVAWLDEHLGFAGRIGRDDWMGQAGRLSAAG